MARYRSRLRKTVYVKPKKRWATNIMSFNKNFEGGDGLFAATQVLVENSTQNSSPTPTIVKTGNFKIQGDCTVTSSSSNAVIGISMYVIYVPEGITITSPTSAQNLINAHPEWILSWKFVAANRLSGTSDNVDAFSFSSRLKRNLNSGDTIQLISTRPILGHTSYV